MSELFSCDSPLNNSKFLRGPVTQSPFLKYAKMQWRSVVCGNEQSYRKNLSYRLRPMSFASSSNIAFKT